MGPLSRKGVVTLLSADVLHKLEKLLPKSLCFIIQLSVSLSGTKKNVAHFYVCVRLPSCEDKTNSWLLALLYLSQGPKETHLP